MKSFFVKDKGHLSSSVNTMAAEALVTQANDADFICQDKSGFNIRRVDKHNYRQVSNIRPTLVGN